MRHPKRTITRALRTRRAIQTFAQALGQGFAKPDQWALAAR